jgi:hypothetical protein
LATVQRTVNDVEFGRVLVMDSHVGYMTKRSDEKRSQLLLWKMRDHEDTDVMSPRVFLSLVAFRNSEEPQIFLV